MVPLPLLLKLCAKRWFMLWLCSILGSSLCCRAGSIVLCSHLSDVLAGTVCGLTLLALVPLPPFPLAWRNAHGDAVTGRCR